MARTVRQLRHAVSRRLDDLWTGTLTQPAVQGAKQLQDLTRIEAVNFFSNYHAYIDQGSAGEEHRVQSSGSGSITLAGDGLTAAKVAGTVYELHKRWSLQDYIEFLQDAILDAASEGVLGNVRDESLTMTADTFEYTLPAGIRYIWQVWQADAAGKYTEKLFPNYHLDILPGATKLLRWSQLTPLVAGRKLRILGQGVEAIPTNADSASITLDSSFLTKHMEVALHRVRSAENSTAGQASGRLLRSLENEIELRRAAMVGEHRVLPGSLPVLQ